MKKIFLLTIIIISLQTQAQNYSLSFDGTNDYVNVPDNNSLDFIANYTLEAWIKPTSLGDWERIVSKYHNNVGPYSFTFRVKANGCLDFNGCYTSAGVITNNNWYHVAAVDNNGTLSIYVNGISKSLSSTTAIFTVTANADPVSVGADFDTRYFDGSIDEVRIWNVARTTTEIKQNMFNKNLSNSASGLVAYYRFNENIGLTTANSCTNTSGIDGTLNNGPTWAASPVQFAKNALNFDGTNDEVLISDANSLDLTNSLTIEAWLFPTSTSTIQSVVSKSSNSINTGYIFPRTNDGWDSFVCYLFLNGGWQTISYNPSGSLLNSWHHFACTYDGSTAKLYLDGGLVATSNYSGSIATNTNSLVIGRQYGFNNEWYTGSIDELRIWNVARTAAEIANNYTVEIDPTTTGLVAYYNFNQGSTAGTNTGLTTLMDNTSSNNGTLTNLGLTTGATSNYVVQNSSLFALPLQWHGFTAKKQNNKVLLEWSTAQEQNTKDFIVQHSTNGAEYKNIGNVTAAGNSNTIKEYNYLHTTPIKSNNYYRILQRDFDGKSSYSEVRLVKFQNTIDKFKIIGNPVVNGKLQVTVFSTCTLTLHSSDGTILWTKQFAAGTQTLDLSKYAKGIYLLKVDEQSEKILVK